MNLKISGVQVFWIILSMNLGMTLVMTITPSLEAAKQDAWLSILAAGCIALVIALLVTAVARIFPGQNLIDFAPSVLGTWPGKLVIVIYLVQWYTITPIVLRQFSDLVSVMLLPETPEEFVILLMVLLIAYASYSGGIEGIARCSEFLGPIILIMVVLVLLANINNINLKHILPFYADSGYKNIIKGALAPASYLGHSVEYLMFASFLSQPRKGRAYTILAVLVANLIVLLTTIMIIAVLGVNLSPNMWYPFFEMAQKISLFGFIDNFDAVPVVIWISSVFVKLAVYFFLLSYGTAQFLKIRSWRIMTWFIAPVMFVFALIPQNVIEATTNYLQRYWVPFALPVNMLGLPFLLLVIGKLKKGSGASAAKNGNG
ncbi:MULTISPECIES: endospore germination permease [unclassified Paenibacillus]|uniref:GerAB/ArcD/ProY family transporter n=1 Tax=unclassified Paenibacillus TaxID=185978 RepID=UPI00240756A9|nr:MULTISPECIES: endospore germination permease [unclassified Paenibacillus]MDF9844370.1 spore germination protein KB [Paenibacillus sp. PastF-2]MDF9850974.1 spore germination protein KB [Paenibacillus sp. PastM-2]MDF9857545.1 spore germination protein KB [Paenibacillus sp. PastF-1]MDH6482814.1 spore germination protein KB [Paenibacillus sp. PastH-2]MDH6510239.1 spore germination protein KB [Paenibacillus sp. PastM-3]